MTISDTTFTSKNPMTGEILWEGSSADEEQVSAAVDSARNALPEWANLTMEEREKFLNGFKEALQKKKDYLAEVISKETGKPLWESKAEVGAMIAKVDISIDAQRQRCPEITKQLPLGFSVTRHKPLGVAAVLGPYNFPGHLPNGHIVPALLAGNTVVFKPSEQTPLVGEEMVNIWKEANLPEGILNIVQGGLATGRALSQHPDINALLFTGSWKTGKLLAQQFAKSPDKLLALEMGGNNPLVIGNISDMEAAAYLIIQSAFITAGQRCTCARRLVIPNDTLGDAIITALLDMTPNITIGAYTDTPEPYMGPVIDQHASNSMLTTQTALTSMGGKALLTMKSLKQDTPLISPAIVDVTEMPNRPDEEYFGPLLQVIRVNSFDDAIKEANNTYFGLSAGILTDDRSQYETFYKYSRAGIINWNSQTTGASSAAPFGGVGRSGNFRPSALYAADYCNYPVASIEAETLKMPEKTAPGIKVIKE